MLALIDVNRMPMSVVFVVGVGEESLKFVIIVIHLNGVKKNAELMNNTLKQVQWTIFLKWDHHLQEVIGKKNAVKTYRFAQPGIFRSKHSLVNERVVGVKPLANRMVEGGGKLLGSR